MSGAAAHNKVDEESCDELGPPNWREPGLDTELPVASLREQRT